MQYKYDNYKILNFIIKLVIDAIVLIIASNIFKGFYIESFGYALITSLLVCVLNTTVKPILNILLLPITILTTGLFYPFINVIILKIAGLMMGNAFIIEGWFVPFFISIFISITTIIIEEVVEKGLGGR